MSTFMIMNFPFYNCCTNTFTSIHNVSINIYQYHISSLSPKSQTTKHLLHDQNIPHFTAVKTKNKHTPTYKGAPLYIHQALHRAFLSSFKSEKSSFLFSFAPSPSLLPPTFSLESVTLSATPPKIFLCANHTNITNHYFNKKKTFNMRNAGG